jgi:hypothetical protein
LWDNFPQTVNGENDFYAAAHYDSTGTLAPLAYTSDYSFSLDGVLVERAASEPLIFMKPSATGTAVLYGIPSGFFSLHVTGQFDLGATQYAHVSVGTVLMSDLDTFTPLFQYDFNPTSEKSAAFDLLSVMIDPAHALVFAVDQGAGDASAYLQASIDATPVPLPGALLLFGSGLLGLAGWRRKFRN